mgnify:CR=1 FL=1
MSLETVGVLGSIGFFLAGVLAGYIIWGVDTFVPDSYDDEEQED